LAKAFSDYLTSLNVVYAEAHISPIDSCCVHYGDDFRRHPEGWRDFLQAWVSAFAEINREKDRPQVRLIVDLVRNHGPETAHWQLDIFKEFYQDQPEICGFGLGGGMGRFRIAEFHSVADRIRNTGLPFFIHAGEYGPAETAEAEVSSAVELGAARIGHGIHISQSKKIMENVKESGIALEVCPGSNIRTGTVSSLSEHPLPVLYQNGLSIVIGSDDPCFFGNNICQEYEDIANFMHFSNSELEQLLINSVECSFAPAALKKKTLEYYREIL
jgi:adenosine deaminase